MAASVDYTAAQFWAEAIRDLPTSKVNEIGFMRFRLVDRSVLDTASAIYDIVGKTYMTAMPIQSSSTGNFSSATGTWTASTSTLVITMNSPFSASDINKVIVFRGTTNTYLAIIQSVTNGTTVVLSGYSLPSSDIATVNSAMVVDTALTSDSISLSGVRFMRVGQQIRFELESTATTSIEAISSKSLRTWLTSGQNSKKIVFTYEGDQLRLAKGVSLSSYGTSTLWYPRIPLQVTGDNSPIDLPDGLPMRLGILRCSVLVGRRIGINIDASAEVTEIINSLYRVVQGEISKQGVQNIVSALA